VSAFITAKQKDPPSGRSSSGTGYAPRSNQATLPPRSWCQAQAQVCVAEVIALSVGARAEARQGVRFGQERPLDGGNRAE
jgi:hypothetical protein